MVNTNFTAHRAFLVKLPQEIRDEVYAYTFTAPSARKQDLNTPTGREEYISHLKLLQVDRASRVRYIASYYGTCTFVVTHTWFVWLQSLSQMQREALLRVEAHCKLYPSWRQIIFDRGVYRGGYREEREEEERAMALLLFGSTISDKVVFVCVSQSGYMEIRWR
jgi:hypothetical protein